MAGKVVRLAEFRGRQRGRQGQTVADATPKWIAMDSGEPVSVTLTMPLSMWRELSEWLKARDVAILPDIPASAEGQSAPTDS